MECTDNPERTLTLHTDITILVWKLSTQACERLLPDWLELAKWLNNMSCGHSATLSPAVTFIAFASLSYFKGCGTSENGTIEMKSAYMDFFIKAGDHLHLLTIFFN